MDEVLHSAKPGDLIEIFHELYEHWAIYIGGNEVVHLGPQEKVCGSSGNLMILLNIDDAQVKRQNIWEVVGSCKWHINNLLDHKYQPLDRQVIVAEAQRLVGQKRQYGVITQNCEHFVTGLRYNKPESQQVERAAPVIGCLLVAGISIIGILLSHLRRSWHSDDNRNRAKK
ncbi:phospholipase A and acyltransferase 4-like [Chaetodon trifascialis]|uniref:phospholipase A and acyltransferase 4-like n=1 Tax=Chaetodon trifascialis TaxID=109706 RepID=UPI003991AE33